MQKNFKSIFLGLVLIGGLGMIGCQSIQDEDEVKELEKVKIEVPVNKDEKEDEETKQLSLEEVETIVKDVINEIGATSMKDMGKVMKAAKEKIGAASDGKTINEVVKNCLE